MRLRTIAISIVVATTAANLTGLSEPALDLISDLYLNLNLRFKGLAGVIVGAIVTGGIAWIALRTNAAVNIRNKRIDVIIHCNNRYDDLYKLRQDIEKDDLGSSHIKSYFRRYWGLQSDQIDYWLAGYIDPETMTSWISQLTSSLKNKSIGGRAYCMTYAQSWQNGIGKEHRIINKRLDETVRFALNYLTKIDDDRQRYAITLQYLRILEANERSLIRSLSRNYHNRMDINDLAVTIPLKIREQYDIFEVRIFPFNLLSRIRATAWRSFAMFLDWIQANSMERLSHKLSIIYGKTYPEFDQYIYPQTQLTFAFYDELNNENSLAKASESKLSWNRRAIYELIKCFVH